MNFSGELFALVTSICWAICIFPFTVAARKLGPNAINHFRLLLACLMITLFLLIPLTDSALSPAELFTRPSAGSWIWLGISGIIGFSIGDYFGFVMFSILGPRIGSLFNTIAPGAALLFGYMILDESLNTIGMIGLIITLGGVAWLTLSKKEQARMPDLGFGRINKGVFFGILSAVCQGIGLVFSKKGMTDAIPAETLSPLHATWMRLFAATAAMYLFSAVTGRLKELNRPILENRGGGLLPTFTGTFFGPVLGVAFALYSITLIKVSVAQTIFSLVPVFALPIARFYNKEKISAKAIIGAIIAIAGVLILIWREEIYLLLN